MNKIQSVRGMNDILPDSIHLWRQIEEATSEIFHSYGYKEIRFPIVEHTALFKRAIGEVTDIVEKEMYTFEDRNGDSLSLRPEGTASCVRACEQNGLLYNQTQKLWYGGPMFRHERPQKGRLRQFHQYGVEAYGFSGIDIEFEMLLMTFRLWRKLNLHENITLQINTIGNSSTRKLYKSQLVSYLEAYENEIDEDSRRRLKTNPLRILDSKDSRTLRILEGAPSLSCFIEKQSKTKFEQLISMLEFSGINVIHNPNLVRGLDYYNDTVFEWVSTDLGAQNTVCAGGRYDNLVEQLGGKATSAFGLAIGMERLVLLLESFGNVARQRAADVYFIVEEQFVSSGIALLEKCRDLLPDIIILVNMAGGSIKNQFKKADKSGAILAIIYGQEEALSGDATVKMLRNDGAQFKVKTEDLPSFLIKNVRF